jgi:serine/threonine-protein kinase
MRWRRQARDWLRADLAAWRTTLDGGAPADRVLVRKTVGLWQVDPDLAGLRESSAMDRLSTDERTECLALWQAVGNLLRRAREGK